MHCILHCRQVVVIIASLTYNLQVKRHADIYHHAVKVENSVNSGNKINDYVRSDTPVKMSERDAHKLANK